MFTPEIKKGVLFKELTTVGIGGKAQGFFEATTQQGLREVINYAQENNLPFFIMGGGSNLLVSDQGLDKLVIKIATIGVKKQDDLVIAEAGTRLQQLVDFTIIESLAGANKMTGIPGTVGGAIFGNAGAYGQTISDHLVKIIAYDPDKQSSITLDKEPCQFNYRDSGFKRNNLIILEAWFSFPKGESGELAAEAKECLKLRQLKYPPGVKCPGSFFKNLFTKDIPEQILQQLPPRKDTFGKTPAYVFIDQLGLKGKQLGQIKIADYHGNLFINLGGGSAKDFWSLAKECVDQTKLKFGIELEPEVQLINLPPLL